MAKEFDPYDDFYDEDEEEVEYVEDEDDFLVKDIQRLKKLQQDTRKKARMRDSHTDIGRVIPVTKEALARKEMYLDDYPAAHQDIFTESTGIKPFGPSQLESINRTQHVLKHGGRSVIAEPRGFGKSSRTANNALLGVLQGRVDYTLILASSVNKAEDILEAIVTELVDNDELYKLYPVVCECFRQATDNFQRALRQTYKGERTYIGMKKGLIRMPVIPGEPSSGSIIQVRSKDNVRGLAVKVRYGEKKGKVLRPDFVFMDDIQTDEEAESETIVKKIIQTIKKSVLFAGSHSRRISGIMCCTPICPGDVSSHFILNEPSWDVIVSSMVTKMPKNLDMWLTDYSNILLDFDRYKTGSRTEAQLRARKFVEDHYEELHEGAEVAWDWAYGWAEDPQTEISALQHAMNFLIEEGEESFNSECQCIVQQKTNEAEGVKVTMDEIMERTHGLPRFKAPVEANFIVTHIDVNKHILSYTTMTSPRDLRPMVIDYGTFPEQPGVTWSKQSPVESLGRRYKDVPEDHERIYLGVKTLINILGDRTYMREDGLEMKHNLILVDMGYMIDEVQRAIRDSRYKHITCAARGQGIGAKKKQFMDRHYGADCEKHFHCATVPTRDRTLTAVYMDINYYKTLIHKGFKTRKGLGGAITLFEPERTGEHLVYAKHCVAETPLDEYDEENDRHVTVWTLDKNEDNEYFDNTVGCLAAFFKLGCELRRKREKTKGKYDIGTYLYGENQSESA